MTVIECRELTKRFGKTTALNKLSFKLEENKITGLIGRNGAGKTTLLKIITGMVKKNDGEMKVFDENPFNNLTVSANTIFVHNQMNLPFSLNLKETLEMCARFYQNWDYELANNLFDYFSFQPFQQFSRLSLGMKSTFGMILGLASHCPLTIFDEPTTGMDSAVRKDFYRALLKDYIAFPRSIILSSHQLEEMEDLLEDILLINDGKELLHLPVSDLNEWAVGLQGKSAAVEMVTENKEVIFAKSLGHDRSFVVIRNNLSEMEGQNVGLTGVEILPVCASDLCVYLTSKTKGGIDDVFNKG